MKVLVTGANGFLGKYILKELKVKPITLGTNSLSDIIADLSKIIPLLSKFDLVIHCAGKAHSLPKTETEIQSFFDVNVKGTENLLKGIENSGLPKQFVFISSVSVYGQDSGLNISEDHPLEAKDSYGLSKIEAEKLVVDWCRENNVICTILRLPLLIGKNPPGNLSAMIKAIDKGYYFNIAGGKAKKSMVLAQDIAKFIPKVATIGGTYNLTDGVHPNFYELSTAILRQNNKKEAYNLPFLFVKVIGHLGDLFGQKAPINSYKIKKITSNLTFDDSKARCLLHWDSNSVLEYLKTNKL